MPPYRPFGRGIVSSVKTSGPWQPHGHRPSLRIPGASQHLSLVSSMPFIMRHPDADFNGVDPIVACQRPKSHLCLTPTRPTDMIIKVMEIDIE